MNWGDKKYRRERVSERERRETEREERERKERSRKRSKSEDTPHQLTDRSLGCDIKGSLGTLLLQRHTSAESLNDWLTEKDFFLPSVFDCIYYDRGSLNILSLCAKASSLSKGRVTQGSMERKWRSERTEIMQGHSFNFRYYTHAAK